MPKEVKLCPHCNAKMVEYKHSLSKKMVRGFFKLVKKTNPGNRFSFKDFPEFTVSEYNNLHKLQYWGLIIKPIDDAEIGGDWIITPLGFDFIAGRTLIEPTVWTYRNKVVRFEGEAKSVTQITGPWKYRPDYIRERVDHLR